MTDIVCQAGNGSLNLVALQPEATQRMSKALRSISQRVAVACLPLTDPILIDEHFEQPGQRCTGKVHFVGEIRKALFMRWPGQDFQQSQ